MDLPPTTVLITKLELLLHRSTRFFVFVFIILVVANFSTITDNSSDSCETLCGTMDLIMNWHKDKFYEIWWLIQSLIIRMKEVFTRLFKPVSGTYEEWMSVIVKLSCL